jgi:hypothetical protein
MSSALYGIVVRHEQDLYLVSRVTRRPSGIYYLIPRANKAFAVEADAEWDPHASYHSDGWHHVKSFDQTFARTKRQPLASLQGVEPLFSQSFAPGDLTNLPTRIVTQGFSELVEIPFDCLDATEHYAVAVHLLSPGSSRPSGP